MVTHTGMTIDAFHTIVKNWLNKTKHPRWDRPYTLDNLVFSRNAHKAGGTPFYEGVNKASLPLLRSVLRQKLDYRVYRTYLPAYAGSIKFTAR
jgi:hypothetical protein